MYDLDILCSVLFGLQLTGIVTFRLLAVAVVRSSNIWQAYISKLLLPQPNVMILRGLILSEFPDEPYFTKISKIRIIMLSNGSEFVILVELV